MKVKGHHLYVTSVMSAKIKIFGVTNSLLTKMRYVLRRFRRSYLKAKSAKVKSQGKLNMHIISESVLCCLPKIIKISACLTKLQLAKVGSFFTAQHVCIAQTMPHVATCLSVHLSVTCRYCV